MSLTIEDIRNPARLSGFNHVESAGGHSDGRNTTASWRFTKRDASGTHSAGGGTPKVRGHARRLPEDAAQDYCDYINSGQAGPATPALKSAGHNGRRARLPDDPEIEAALGVLRDAKGPAAGKQGFVYCITDSEYVKIGYSTNPQARVAELQTGNGRPLRLLAAKKGSLADEAAVHQRHIEHNVLMEWFCPAPALLSEFGLSTKDIGART